MKIKDLLVYRLAVMLGLLTVVLGSLGAHAIKFKTPELHKLFDIGLLYQAIHVPVLFILAILGFRKQALLMFGGLVGFCWAVILKSLTEISLGPIVPTGGMVLMLAWILLFFPSNDVKMSDTDG